jgi:hypothetical protein
LVIVSTGSYQLWQCQPCRTSEIVENTANFDRHEVNVLLNSEKFWHTWLRRIGLCLTQWHSGQSAQFVANRLLDFGCFYSEADKQKAPSRFQPGARGKDVI